MKYYDPLIAFMNARDKSARNAFDGIVRKSRRRKAKRINRAACELFVYVGVVIASAVAYRHTYITMDMLFILYALATLRMFYKTRALWMWRS